MAATPTPKLTLDAGLRNMDTPEIKTLKKWEQDNLVALFDADRSANPTAPRKQAYTWPGASPSAPPAPRASQRSQSSNRSKQGQFKQIAALVHQGKNIEKLDMVSINFVAHLLVHLNSERDYFVTQNSEIFLDSNKPERLKSAFGIVVLSPKDAVELLVEGHGLTAD